MRQVLSLVVVLTLATAAGLAAVDLYRESAREAAPHQVEQIPAACIPFAEPIVDRPIDKASGDQACGLPGVQDEVSAESTQHGLQNRIKNNFCAWQGMDPALVTMRSFKALNDNMPPMPGGRRGQPLPTKTQRDTLKAIHITTEGDTIGEGSFVQFRAFLLEGHFGGSETVNCGNTKRQSVDIHLAFVEAKPTTLNLADHQATECTSISAELSPHHRPIDWDILGRMTKSPAAEKLIGALARLKDEDLVRPLRIRGQLFFDASHTVCSGGRAGAGHPARRSNWEIHPVYSIHVCDFTTFASCPIDNKDRWKPLSEVLRADDDEGGRGVPATGQDTEGPQTKRPVAGPGPRYAEKSK